MKTIKCRTKFVPGDLAIKIGESHGNKVFEKVVIQAVEYKAFVDNTFILNEADFQKATKGVIITGYKINYVRNDEVKYGNWSCSECELMTMNEFKKLMKKNHSTYNEYLNWVNKKDWKL